MKEELEKYFDRLWPVCRSITGKGLRDSLKILQEIIPLELSEVPTASQVFDWEIPKEWNIVDAYIITPDGKKIAEFSVSNLHVVSYSVPVNKKMSYDELRPHIHTIPSIPDAIPYVTSYYKEDWGFCLAHEQWEDLPKTGEYRVVIDSSLKAGSLTYGQLLLKGKTDDEVLFSTYVCHPSMANNELSGPLATAFLYREIEKIQNRKYSYRFVFAPETIGVLAFLAEHGETLIRKLKAGYVLTCCADGGQFNYKKSKQGHSLADRVAEHVLKHSGKPYTVHSFSVGGSDERQYCSPGFNLPVGSLMRTPYQQYRQYHTSLDNKDFISFDSLAETISTYKKMVQVLELNEKYMTTVMNGEPQMGRRGLYPASSNPVTDREYVHRMMHLISFADGKTDLVEIAELQNAFVPDYDRIIKACMEKDLLIVPS